MTTPLGSRGYEYINYKDTCVISGVNHDFPVFHFRMEDGNHHIIIRADFVEYIYPFLAYKFGITNDEHSIVAKWSLDEWKYHQNKIYGKSIFQDYRTTLRTLSFFEGNFLNTDTAKIVY